MDPSTLLEDEPVPPEETEEQTDDEESQDPAPDADELDEAEIVRRNAAQKITRTGKQLRKTDLALVDLIAETPGRAPEIIARIKGENPDLARRLSKLYLKRESSGIQGKFTDPQVQEAFEALSAQVETLSDRTESQRIAQEKRLFKQWRATASDLDDADLRKEFRTVLETRFSESEVTEDLLDDALAIAKRRIGWQDEPVRAAARRIAAEQAARARIPSPPSGGRGVSHEPALAADQDIAAKFGNSDPDRLKKVEEFKRKARF